MFYKLISSSNTKITGYCNSQAEHPVDFISPDISDSYRNYFLRKAPDPDKVITATPILVKRATLTDLISGSAIGNSIQKMISNLLKEILEAENNQGLQFFPMSVLYKGIELKNYWLANPHKFDYESIDFEKSIIELVGMGNQKIREIKVMNETEFGELSLRIKPPEGLFFSKIVFKPNLQKRLLLIRGVSGGVGYFFSSSLKDEIEDAGCTGMDFIPAE